MFAWHTGMSFSLSKLLIEGAVFSQSLDSTTHLVGEEGGGEGGKEKDRGYPSDLPLYIYSPFLG